MKKINKQNGFTIIETMISVSLFLVVVMIGMGALLNANMLHNKSQNMRSIMDNLSFVMEDMSRNLRTGYDYHCIDNTNDGSFNGINPYSCVGGGISFKSAPFTGQWKYYVDFNPNDNTKYSIFKSVDNGASIQFTPDEININPVSSFSVSGAEAPTPIPNSNPLSYNCNSTYDCQQPFVTIKLVGEIDYKGVKTPFSLQTSVSQRVLDR